MRVYKKVEISAAHSLRGYKGKCKNLHGHNYIIEVWLEGEMDKDTKMLFDFSKIKKKIEVFDHKNLNEFFSNPTAEVLARFLAESFISMPRIRKAKVRVWEDSNSYAEEELCK